MLSWRCSPRAGDPASSVIVKRENPAYGQAFWAAPRRVVPVRRAWPAGLGGCAPFAAPVGRTTTGLHGCSGCASIHSRGREKGDRGETVRDRTWRRTRQRGARLLLVAGLALATAAPARAPLAVRAQDDDLSGRTATIARSDDGVNLREEPGFGGDVVGVLSDGTIVELRIDVADTVLDEDGETRWWPVRVDGQDGWVAGYYLDQDWRRRPTRARRGRSRATESGGRRGGRRTLRRPTTPPTARSPATTATARVTSEDGANLRAEPSASSDVITVLAVRRRRSTLRIDEADTVVRGGVRWWPVRFDGQDGWVAGDYLDDARRRCCRRRRRADDTGAGRSPSSLPATMSRRRPTSATG